jgi:3-oxoacyl-[acyl-carrier protein] reductase
VQRLNGNLALVTGASRKVGIGQSIARTLARRGADVFITYYRPYDLQTDLAGPEDDPQGLVDELSSMGVRAAGLELDLADPDVPHRLFEEVERTLGPVRILINNATYSMRDGIENLTAASLDRHYAVNLRGMALLCAEFIRRYREAHSPGDWGRIINLSSGQGTGPMPGELAYAATKGAVEAFTLSLSAEVAELGVTVNAVDPGITDTGWIPADLKAAWESQAPMGRVGLPEDAARLIAFLASEEARWITGQVIHSRGGL